MTSDSASAVSSRSNGPALASATTARSLGSPSGRQPGAGGGGHSRRSADAAERQLLPRVRGDGARRAVAGSPRWTARRPAGAAVEHEPRAERADDLERHALVVRLRVGEQQRVEPLHPRLGEPAQDRAAGRPGVDQQRGAVALQQRRVALADVEERDDELARARRRGAAVRGGEDERRQPRSRRAPPAARAGGAAGPLAATRGRRARARRPRRRTRRPGRPGRRSAPAARPRAAARRRARSTRGRRAASR